LRKPSLRLHLREQTAAVHAELDRTIGVLDSSQSYRRSLRNLLAFREPAEGVLDDAVFPDWFGGWRPRRIARVIRADMADLGVDAPGRPGRDLCLVDQARNPSGLLGMLYVLEGASLGAKLIYQRAVCLGLSGTYGARHLAMQADDKDNWRRFLEILEGPGIDADVAVRASSSAFALAQRPLG
jgi:heme oxygenase (biliverdin-IX-beta and delta-forming)